MVDGAGFPRLEKRLGAGAEGVFVEVEFAGAGFPNRLEVAAACVVAGEGFAPPKRVEGEGAACTGAGAEVEAVAVDFRAPNSEGPMVPTLGCCGGWGPADGKENAGFVLGAVVLEVAASETAGFGVFTAPKRDAPPVLLPNKEVLAGWLGAS